MPTFTVRTSNSDPLHVDEVPGHGLHGHGLPGRLGLTIAPGKCGTRQLSGGIWKRALDQDLARLRAVYGSEVLVSLMRPYEYEELRIAALDARAAAHGIRVRRFPIPTCAPPPRTMHPRSTC